MSSDQARFFIETNPMASANRTKNSFIATNSPVTASKHHRPSSLSDGNSVVGARLNSIYTPLSNNLSIKGQKQTNNERTYRSKKEEIQYYYNKCLVVVSHSINIIKALVMRCVFSLHSLIAIIYVFLVKKDEWYFINFVGIVFMMIELFVTIIKRKGREPRWFFPCFFIYICTMIPPIWIVELAKINQANSKRRENSTEIDPLESLFYLSDSIGIGDEIIGKEIPKIPIQQIDIATIAVGLEISLLLLVILGRWFLPKGNISRSTLSQLLLVYMSLASDIVDLLSLLNETQVQESSLMTCFTLAIFSWSLFQFSLNLVVTRGRSFQSSAMGDFESSDQEVDEEEKCAEIDSEGGTMAAMDDRKFVETLNRIAQNSKNSLKKEKSTNILNKFIRFDLLDSEIWSILITLIFQDGPFLALRLTAVLKFDVRTFVTMFFTFKNAIILFLQIYRLSAIFSEAKSNASSDPMASNKADASVSLSTAAAYLDKFVVLSYTQSFLNSSKKSSKSLNNLRQNSIEEAEKRLMALNPILIKSTLSKTHAYSIVLAQSSNLNAACCACECHMKTDAHGATHT